MKLTFIIVSYNEIEFLPQAIESCLAQKTSYPYEIVIGDDGSDDGSIELIEDYCRRYPEIISSFVMSREDIKGKDDLIPSARVSAILRRGLSLARGRYIAVLSGDDYFCDNSFAERNIDFLEKDTKEKYAACCNAFQYVYSDMKTEELHFRNLSTALKWARCFTHISSYLFRRKVYTDGNLLDSFIDDTGMVYSVMRTGKVHYFDTVTFSYRQREKSIIHAVDNVELDVLDMVIFQECLEKRKYLTATLAHWHGFAVRVFYNREKLGEKRYEKYFRMCADNKYNVLKLIKDYGQPETGVLKKVSLRGFIFIMHLCAYIYGKWLYICRRRK